MRDARILRNRVVPLVLAMAVACQAGCGYSVRAPFDPSVRTVYVPVFRSISFRRDLNWQLTDLVIKEIEKRGGYKVVGNPKDADTILEGQISVADKNIIVENPNNLPRQLNSTITVYVNWTHNPPTKEEKDRGPTMVTETVNFAPELGETSVESFYRTSQRIAEQIVDMMESPW